MVDFTSEFPLTANYTYLNTASCGLLSNSLVAWRREHDRKLLEGGSIFRDTHKAHIIEIRETIARFFQTIVSNVAMVPNFSFGLNVLIDGLSRGQKVLLIESDYPSVNWPFERRDFDIAYVPMASNLEEHISEAFQKQQPEIFAFSLVQYVSGLKLDMEFLKELKSTYPDTLFIVDGTQFLGTTNFNFNESPLDIIGASAYKWLLSGYGNGLFLIKEHAQDRIHPKFIGYNSADADFSKKNDIEFIGHLEPGHQDTLNYGSLGESLKFLEGIGMSNIESHLDDLTAQIKAELSAMDLLNQLGAPRSNMSTIFNIKGDQALFQKLKENNIIGSLRGDGIRLSFHLYNTQQDLEHLFAVLKGQK